MENHGNMTWDIEYHGLFHVHRYQPVRLEYCRMLLVTLFFFYGMHGVYEWRYDVGICGIFSIFNSIKYIKYMGLGQKMD